jgi:hypothetical protein
MSNRVKRKRWSDFWQKRVTVEVPKGLSTFHIRSFPVLEIASGGSLVQLKGVSVRHDESSLEVSPRGEIRDFSRASRRRLQRLLAQVDKNRAGLPTFLTLTYPGEYSGDWKRWKRDLKAFIEALIRKYPSVYGVWRLEFQKRGAPHYHFLLWDGPVLQDVTECEKDDRIIWIHNPANQENQKMFKWFAKTWYRIVGSGDEKHLAAGTRVEAIQSWNGVIHYASKYLAKLGSGEFVPQGFAGRYWGCVQKRLIPIDVHSWRINEERTFIKIKRVIRKMLEKKVRYKIKIPLPNGISAFMANDASLKLLEWGLREQIDHDILSDRILNSSGVGRTYPPVARPTPRASGVCPF